MFGPATSPWRIKPPLGVRLNRGHPLANGLVARYLFNENGGTKLYDVAGNSTGTLTSGPAWAPGHPGRLGSALSFDGTDDKIAVGNLDTSIGISNRLTFTVWLKRGWTGQTGFKDRIIQSLANNGWGVGFYSNGGADADKLFVTKNGVNDANSTYAITDLFWHYVIVTLDGTNARFYVDGVLRSAPAYSSTFGSAGTYEISTGGLYKGLIDDIRIYSRALLPDEVKQLYLDPYCDMERQRGAIKYFLPSAGGFRARYYYDMGQGRINV